MVGNFLWPLSLSSLIETGILLWIALHSHFVILAFQLDHTRYSKLTPECVLRDHSWLCLQVWKGSEVCGKASALTLVLSFWFC